MSNVEAFLISCFLMEQPKLRSVFLVRSLNIRSQKVCSPNSLPKENAKIYGQTYICGDARIYGQAELYEDASACGHANVYEYAKIYGYGEVYEDTIVRSNANISGITVISNDDLISE